MPIEGEPSSVGRIDDERVHRLSEAARQSASDAGRLVPVGLVMFRLAFRFIGLLVLAGAFAALVVDGTRSVAAGSIALMPLGRTLSALSPEVLTKLRALVEPRLPLLWDPVLVSLFLLPAWLVLGFVGLVLLALSRPRAPKIGYSRR